MVERDPSKALPLFQQAAQAGGGAEAQYGSGYALWKLGRSGEAVGPLCQAIASGNGEIKREVKSLMERNGLACP